MIKAITFIYNKIKKHCKITHEIMTKGKHNN